MENPCRALSRLQLQNKKDMEKTNDRISQLPDAVLHYILSMMPMKFIIRTSILSKRRRYLWKPICAYSTSLDFGSQFMADQTPEEFVAAVNRYLLLHKAKEIHMVRLLIVSQDPSDAEKWAEFAVSKGVKELHITFFVDETFERPIWKLYNSIFNCDSLTHLNLSSCEFIPPLNFKGCTFLKTLHLTHVRVTDALFENMLLNLPLLEELILSLYSGLTHLKFSAPNLPLKRLTVVDECKAYDIEIFAPNLESFHFYGNFIPMYFENISSLVDVFINDILIDGRLLGDWMTIVHHLEHVKVLTLSNVSPKVYVHSYSPMKFLIGLVRAIETSTIIPMIFICIRCGPPFSCPWLKISLLDHHLGFTYMKQFMKKGKQRKMLTSGPAWNFSSRQLDPPDVCCLENVSLTEGNRPEDLPITFHNLQELQLLMDWFDDIYLPYTYSFFKNGSCPCLEKLFIRLPPPYGCEKLPSDDTPDIVFGNLKVIKINDFGGFDDEKMQLVKFFLEKAIVLESLVLVASPLFPGEHTYPPLSILREQLLMLAKASSSGAEILIREYSDDDGTFAPTHTEIYYEFGEFGHMVIS